MQKTSKYNSFNFILQVLFCEIIGLIYFRVIEEFMKIQEATFDMCIDQLKKEMKERYENLVIFSEDVNIMSKV